MNFAKFKTAVATQFELMCKYPIFRTSVDKSELWDTYLASFPAGTNPIYRTRTEHDCSRCKQFIRAIGDVVAIIDHKLISIWDCNIDDSTYQSVAKAMSSLVKSHPVANIFLHSERTAGADKTFEQLTEGIKTWNHFFVNIPQRFINRDPGTKLGECRSSYDVLLRSLTELSDEAVDTVLELISQNSLYRGEEHKFAVQSFKQLKQDFKDAGQNSLFVWEAFSTLPSSVCRIRNTAIGTLLVDLSNDVDLETAVRAFESKVAPTNYKRPTALVTKTMVDNAKRTINELGLTSALERRFATIHDISVNNLLFVDRSVSSTTTNDPFDGVATKSAKSLAKVEEVPIAKFLADILPGAKTLEAFIENPHAANMVSLIAPVDPTAGQLFKWGNGFSWSYNGDVTDSIKERVKQAGGNVTGELCCRLAWDNTDDLDFHMIEPSGARIYYGNRRERSSCGGMLDVDANGADGLRANPVENIFYETLRSMREGVYKLIVHNFNRRSKEKPGFDVEIDIKGVIHHLSYDKPVKDNENIHVADLQYSRAEGIKLIPHLPSSQSTRTFWNVSSQDFHKVSAVMLSPNHWDEPAVGNKHYFFMLDQCRNEGTARGFYNEFLKEELNAHRKVIEIVGSKMRTDEAHEQLSGLGFSSTQRNTLVCRVTGSFARTVKVIF